MAKPTVQEITKASSDLLAKSGQAAEKIMKANTDALTESLNASTAAVQELSKAYQELVVKDAKILTASIQALSAVKSPVEFVDLQQKLMREGIESAVSDSRHIAQLTAAVFTSAFEPLKKQIEAVQKTTEA